MELKTAISPSHSRDHHTRKQIRNRCTSGYDGNTHDITGYTNNGTNTFNKLKLNHYKRKNSNPTDREKE